MAITLAEAKVGMADHIDQQIIETMQKSSRLMDALIFDDALSPGTGGSTLIYGYTQMLTPATSQGRKINEDYVPQEAKRTTKTTTLTIMGGAYEIDRALAKTTNRQIDEVTFQSTKKAEATASRFQYLAINGIYDQDATDPEFDGLSKLLEGTENEIPASTVDLSGAMTEEKAYALDEALMDAIGSMDGTPTMIIANTKAISKIKTAAHKLGYYTQNETSFGKKVDAYNGIELVDLKQFYNGTNNVDVVPVEDGSTDIFIVRIGLDAFCGVTPDGTFALTKNLPNFNEAGAVKRGDVEVIGGVALKNTKAAAVLRGVKVATA